MGTYERIKGSDDEESRSGILVDPNFDALGADKDVELGLHMSHSVSSATAKLGEVSSYPSNHRRRHQQKHARERLVSLDVFRGLTVAVFHFYS